MANTSLAVAAKAVIVKDGKILVVREAKSHSSNTKAGQYQVVGGRINADEKFDDGLDREVMEETGLKVRQRQPIFLGEWWPEVNGKKLHIVAMFIICDAEAGEINLSEEHDGYKWVDDSSVSSVDIMAPDNEAVKRVLEVLSD